MDREIVVSLFVLAIFLLGVGMCVAQPQIQTKKDNGVYVKGFFNNESLTDGIVTENISYVDENCLNNSYLDDTNVDRYSKYGCTVKDNYVYDRNGIIVSEIINQTDTVRYLNISGHIYMEENGIGSYVGEVLI